MINTDILQGLKRTNCSSDNEKTKVRVKSIMQDSSPDEKKRFLNTTDISSSTIFRIYNTGTVIPKVVVHLAQHFNCDPSYITGDTDERGEWNVLALESFLRSKGYDKLLELTAGKPKRKYTKRNSPLPADSGIQAITEHVKINKEIIAEDVAECITPCATDIQDNGDTVDSDIPIDELILLLNALHIRAKHNEQASLQLKSIVKTLLL